MFFMFHNKFYKLTMLPEYETYTFRALHLLLSLIYDKAPSLSIKMHK